MNANQISLLCDQWRAKADDYDRISKAYRCRSNESVRIAYIKQAAQARMCADELEEALAEAQRQSFSPIGQEGAAESEPDQAPGSLDLPGLQEGDDAASSGPQGSTLSRWLGR